MPAADIYQIDSISMNGPNLSIDFSGNNNNPVITNATVTYDPSGDNNSDTTMDPGDTFLIDLGDGNGQVVATVDFTMHPNGPAHGDILVFTVNGTQYGLNDGSDDIPFGGAISPSQQKNGSVVDNDIPFCFVRGTQIATPDGNVLIENLALDDLVITANNGSQKIRWIGKTAVKTNNRNGHLLPIRITAGALGDNKPAQDLLVSPAHRMLVSGWQAELLFGEQSALVAAKSLVNDSTISIARDLKAFEYFHIMFDNHEIITSNGALSESFHATANSIENMETETRAELLALFPRLEAGSTTVSAQPVLSGLDASLLR